MCHIIGGFVRICADRGRFNYQQISKDNFFFQFRLLDHLDLLVLQEIPDT